MFTDFIFRKLLSFELAYNYTRPSSRCVYAPDSHLALVPLRPRNLRRRILMGELDRNATEIAFTHFSLVTWDGR